MAQPYVGEIRIFAGNFAPSGWALCQGQIMPIDQNTILFTLIGTTYGGDGQTTFALPNLQSRVAIHQGNLAGNNYVLGQAAGVETVQLTTQQIPSHSHVPQAATAASTTDPTNAVFGGGPGWFEGTTAPGLQMNPNMIALAGNSLPHDNMVPFLGLNFIISLFGIFPSQ
jgi:microcystin-dependent protein